MSYDPNASGVYNSTAPTLANGQSSAIQLDVNGNTKVVVENTVPVSGSVSVSNLPATQAVSSTQLPTSLDGSGNLKVAVENSPTVTVGNASLAVTGTFYPATQPVSIASAVTVAQPTAANLQATVTLAGNQTITDVPATSGGWSTNVQQAVTTDAQVKSSAGQLGGYSIFNGNTGTVFVYFYNTTSAPTIGSTTSLIYQVGIPAGGGAHIEFGKGIAFSSGIYVAVSTSATSSTAPSTGLLVTTIYK